VLNNKQLEQVIGGISDASKIALSYYRKPDLSIITKKDLSPVTEADLISNQFIRQFLQSHFPDIPLISEEEEKEDYEIRKTREYSWILDPIDGTSEFIACNDEFAINLALLHYDHPVFGIISIPAKNLIYYAIKGGGSWKINPDGVRQRLPLTVSDHQTSGKLKVLISRSHASHSEQEFCNKLEALGWLLDVRPTGSAYKHVLVAEGTAHLYYKPGICWEWDTAPGQLIIEEAGGSVLRLEDGAPLVYNKASFQNPGFIMWAPGAFIPL